MSCLLLFLSFSTACGETKVVKILAIGNSFSQDAVEQYLHELAEADGMTAIIGNMYIGGCSLERHVDNARNNAPDYVYRKIGTDGKRRETRNMTLEKALADEDWDYVSLQQASTFSGIYSTYAASLPELVDYVKARLPKNTKLMLHQTWAYQSDSKHGGFKNYDRNQMVMYRDITAAVRKAAKLNGIKIIIPTGTAIQNARTSFIGDHLTRDGYHLSLDLGRYTAACTWFETVFGRSVIGNRFAPKGMDESRKRVAQKSAHEAVRHPRKVTKITVK